MEIAEPYINCGACLAALVVAVSAPGCWPPALCPQLPTSAERHMHGALSGI